MKIVIQWGHIWGYLAFVLTFQQEHNFGVHGQ